MKYTEEMLLQAAREAYAQGDLSFDLRPEECALLVIDMQDEFIRPGWTSSWIPAATRMVGRVKELIGFCRENNIPVIYTAFKNTYAFFDRPRTGVLMPNRYPQWESDPSWFREGRIWHEIAPLENELVIYKPSYGAFYDTPLETILRNMGRDCIILCGTLTNYCCGMTARQGYERGFRVVFGSDITATDDPAMQEYELQVLRKGFAKVMDATAIKQQLSSKTS